MRLSPITCREAAQMLTEARDRRLSLAERLGLRIHLFICGPCRNYLRQLRFLGRAGDAASERAGDAGAELGTEARERIRRKLGR